MEELNITSVGCDGSLIFHLRFCYDSTLCRTPANPCDECNGLEALEAQIEESIATLKKLATKRQKMRTQLNCSHSQIIEKIPSEVMSSIFQFCTPISRSKVEELQWAELTAPLRLGAVCSSWRQIAWSTPQLWTHLSIFLNKDAHSQYTDLIQEWIYRSKTLPIRISLSGLNSIPIDLEDNSVLSPYYHLIKILAQFSDRWSSVFIDMPVPWMKFLYDHCQNLSMIQDLSLFGDIYTTTDNIHNISSLWTTEPEPISVSIFGLLPRQVNLKWNGVTSLTVSGWTTYQCIELLRKAPMLIDCSFERTEITPSWDPLELEKPIVHSNIQTLLFEGTMEHEYFFSVVTFPNLKAFKYNPYEGDGDYHVQIDNLPALRAFFERSGTQLEFLAMERFFLDYDDFRPILHSIPSLKSLCLVPVQALDDEESLITAAPILKHLAATQDISQPFHSEIDNANTSVVEHFLPCLESFTYQTDNAFPWKYVPDIFGHPSQFGHPKKRPLKTFRVSQEYITRNFIPQEILKKIIELNSAGAKISHTDFTGVNLIYQMFLEPSDGSERAPDDD